MFFFLNVNGVGKVPRDIAIVEVGKDVNYAHTMRLIITNNAVLKVDTA
jgi:hypothetical protein